MPAKQDLHNSCLDEGSWIYLSLGGERRTVDQGLRRGLVGACEASGWPAVSWVPASRSVDHGPDDERLLEGLEHAVKHADAVVILVGEESAAVERELNCAFRHGRPVIGLCLEGTEGTETKARIRSGDRGRLVECADLGDCPEALRKALADPELAGTMREAVAEPLSHV